MNSSSSDSILANSRYLVLNAVPCTDQARKLGVALASRFLAPSGTTRGRPKNFRALEEMILAVVADAMGAHRLDLWVYRSRDKNSFVEEGISYRNFTTAMNGFEAEGLMDLWTGYNPRKIEFGKPERSLAARWRPTAPLIKLCGEYGITPENIEKHFIRKLPEHPIKLKAASSRDKGFKVSGKSMRFEPSEATDLIEGQVREINEYLSGFQITNGTHRAFRRVFNDGDKAGFAWNRGGRFYGDGPDNYQYMPKKERAAILINGEATTEIDIRASDLTILHAKAGLKLPDGDPYAVEGLPREVVKAWFVVLFGKGRLPRQWSKKTRESFEERGLDISRLYPVKRVTVLIRQAYGDLIRYFETSALDSLDFQYLESSAMTMTMLLLKRKHDVPSLPVHDSLIVRLRDAQITREVLKEVYWRTVGLEPVLS